MGGLSYATRGKNVVCYLPCALFYWQAAQRYRPRVGLAMPLEVRM